MKYIHFLNPRYLINKHKYEIFVGYSSTHIYEMPTMWGSIIPVMENSRAYVAWEPGGLHGIPALLSASSMVSGKQLICVP